jgi:hypothetical protein
VEQPNSVPTPAEPPAQPAPTRDRRRKPYARPAIVAETRLETRAGSPLSTPLDPINTRNDYGL